MITLFILGLVGTALILAALPLVGFALMLETGAERAAAPSVLWRSEPQSDEEEPAPLTLRPSFP
jgi:hypothetical protein